MICGSWTTEVVPQNPPDYCYEFEIQNQLLVAWIAPEFTNALSGEGIDVRSKHGLQLVICAVMLVLNKHCGFAGVRFGCGELA